MSKPKILVAFDTLQEGFEPLAEHFEIIRPPKGRDFSSEEIKELLPSCEALCPVFDIPIGRDIIDAGRELKLIANYAVGYNNIDIAYAKERGIAVANTPEAVVAPTAELAMALMLAASRRVAEWDRTIREKGRELFVSRLDRLGWDLYGKRMGIVGFGNIGMAVAKRAQAFGMEIVYYKRTPIAPDMERQMNVSYLPLNELFSTCDVVSLHTPYNADSHHLVNAERLAKMKPNAILVNTARGAVVDEQALIEALQANSLAAAALDVFEDADKPHAALLAMDNVVMTPHVGTQTYDARLAMIHEMSRNLIGFFYKGGEGVSFVVK